ncbi:MAG TPA: holin-associated N-acetylmuramidase [Thermohalobaculum sp.]|nr:holin-associated N-acetylmuramidase [Thermohalobaculum sp.]
MHTVDELAHEIVGREGGFVDNPNDPGGATNFGVTIGTMRNLGMDLDGDGIVDAEDVKLLTVEQAVEIFKKNYFLKPKISMLPEMLQPSVFDMQVNAGSNAVKLLQQAINTTGFGPVSVDGGIGKQTADAAKKACDAMGMDFVDAYGIARRDYYYRIADNNAKLRVFARRQNGGKGGWIRRAEEFISPGKHLSEAEHAQRVSAWA